MLWAQKKYINRRTRFCSTRSSCRRVLARAILSLNGFHCMRLPAAALSRSSATPLWCMSSSLPEYNIVSPVAVYNIPKPAHLHSLMASMQSLYLLASFMISAVCLTNIVLMFQHPTLKHSLGVVNSLQPNYFQPTWHIMWEMNVSRSTLYTLQFVTSKHDMKCEFLISQQ